MGGLVFLHIDDGTGRFQVLIKSDNLSTHVMPDSRRSTEASAKVGDPASSDKNLDSDMSRMEVNSIHSGDRLEVGMTNTTAFSFFIDNFDIGDFAEFTGMLFETKTGEKTLQAKSFRLLAKSLR